MKDFAPTGLPPRPGASPPTQPRRNDEDEVPREPQFEPSEHRFPIDLGDGVRATLPPELVDGVPIAERDLTFEARQHTIAETCQCFRLSTRGEHVDTNEIENQLLRTAIRKVGDKEGAELGDGELDAWLRDIGIQGTKFVNELVARLTGMSKEWSDLYAATYRVDRARRRHTYSIPPVALPRKRWAARTGIDARWLQQVNADKTVTAHWLVNGEPPELDVQNRLNRDLTFTITELTVAQENSIADLAKDPDDTHAVRILSTMLAIVEIGGATLGDSPSDMETKLKWLEDIGPRARLLVTGTYAKLHEVDRVALSRFLASAQPLE